MTNDNDKLRDREEIQEDLVKNQSELFNLLKEKAKSDSIHEGVSVSQALEVNLFGLMDTWLTMYGEAVEGESATKVKMELARKFVEGLEEQYMPPEEEIAEAVGKKLAQAFSEATGQDVEVEQMGVIEAENMEEALEKMKEDLEDKEEEK